MKRIELRRGLEAVFDVKPGGETIRILPPRARNKKTVIYYEGDASVVIQRQDTSTNSETSTQN